ncbi:hypothetical protein VSR01_10505 [Actinacidiphila sp. DG2A-62]|uniref:hypothetical protein n=1 Tax=Actinacidiphila sp. DG2A-62 TaxID=3108821 RepID=UPI002DBA7AC3|nr:hypothetical protein [Actinacidiphila sp. DG2A-62]MEC3993949.1 hypothetical protein [Actinacidiphila sp. DG2A-62]
MTTSPPAPPTAPAAVRWPVRKPAAATPPATHHRALTVTMLLTTVPALLAVAVLRPGSGTYRRNT